MRICDTWWKICKSNTAGAEEDDREYAQRCPQHVDRRGNIMAVVLSSTLLGGSVSLGLVSSGNLKRRRRRS